MENEIEIKPSVEDTIVAANPVDVVPAELPVGEVCPVCGQSPCICTPAEVPVEGEGVPVEGTPMPAVAPVIAITVGQFFGTIQESVRISWTYHLKTRKHRAHLALQEYYEGALDSVDDIIEHYQGINGVVEEEFTNAVFSEGKDEVTYFNELKAFVVNAREALLDNNDTELWSDVDDLLGLIDSTLYKLTAFTESSIKSYDEFVYENYNKSEEEKCNESVKPYDTFFLTESCHCEGDHCDCEHGDDGTEEEEE